MRRVALLLLLSSVACIRSTAEIPGPGEGGFVTGTVVERDLTTSDFRGSPGIRVRAIGVSTVVATNEEGFFQLDRLPLGRHSIALTRHAAPGVAGAGRVLDPINMLVDGQAISLGDLRLLGDGSLTGRVEVRTDPDRLPVGVGGALVVLTQTSFKAITEADGRFQVANLPEGTFDLVAFASGFDPGVVPGVRIVAGAEVTVRKLVLEPGTPEPVTVNGQARRSDTDDHGGITVRFTNEQTGEEVPTAVTGATGSYAIAIPIGVYRVRFEADGYGSADIPGVAVLREGVVGLVTGYLVRQTPGDQDGDGIADDVDDDRDGDGCPNVSDAFPTDPAYCDDTDMDGLADDIDPDDDNDGLSDAEEQSLGADGFITNPVLADTDNDGVLDPDDNCPTVPNATQDPMACVSRTGPSAPPEIDSFTPTSGATGTIVEIVGRNFASTGPTVVQFGVGVAVPELVTNTRILVAVPATARTSSITVYAGDQRGSSAGVFTFEPPPEIVRFEPVAVRPDELVAVYGRRFATGATVLVGVQATMPTACPTGVLDTATAEGLDAVCFRPSIGTVNGPVVVVVANGEDRSRGTLTILEGPQIVGFTVNPVGEGDTTTILGRGFSVRDGGTPVTVDIAGASGLVPTEPSDTALTITIPTGAQTGLVTIRHPSGDITSTMNLVIDNGIPAVTDLAPGAVMVGDTLAIFGVNLSVVTSVGFTGGMSAPVVAPTDGRIEVIVPAVVEPGPVTLNWSGAPIVTRRRLAVIDVFENEPVAGAAYVPGLAFDPSGTVVAMTTIPATSVVRVDPNTLMQVGTPTGHAIGGFPGAIRGTVRGDRGAVIVGSMVHTVSLPDFTILGTCPSDGVLSTYAFVEAMSGRLLVTANRDIPVSGMSSLWRLDLQTATCASLGTTSAFRYAAAVSQGSNALVSTVAQQGFAIMNIDPTDGFVDGDLLTPFGVLGGMASTEDQLFSYLGAPTVVYGMSISASADMSAYDINTGVRRMIGGTRGQGPTFQSRNSRWLLRVSIEQPPTAQLLDLQEEEQVRVDLPSLNNRSAVVMPTGTTFVYRRSDLPTRFVRVTIRE